MVSYYEDTENQQSVQAEDDTLEELAAENDVQSVQEVQVPKTVQQTKAVLQKVQKHLPLIAALGVIVAIILYHKKNGGK